MPANEKIVAKRMETRSRKRNLAQFKASHADSACAEGELKQSDQKPQKRVRRNLAQAAPDTEKMVEPKLGTHDSARETTAVTTSGKETHSAKAVAVKIPKKQSPKGANPKALLQPPSRG